MRKSVTIMVIMNVVFVTVIKIISETNVNLKNLHVQIMVQTVPIALIQLQIQFVLTRANVRTIIVSAIVFLVEHFLVNGVNVTLNTALIGMCYPQLYFNSI